MPEKISGSLSTKTKTTKVRAEKIREAKKTLIWPPNYHIIKSAQELGRLASLISQHGYFSFDTETSGLNPYTCKCYCVTYYIDGKGFLINFSHPLLPQIRPQDYIATISPYHGDGAYEKYGFNLGFDSHVLENNFGIDPGYQHWDASVMSWLIHPELPEGMRKLKRLCENDLGFLGLQTFEEKFGKFAFIVSDPQLASHYAILDAELHYKLGRYYLDYLRKIPSLYKVLTHLDIPFQNELYKTEQDGILVDVNYVRGELSARLEKELGELKAKMIEAGLPPDININSNVQMVPFMFDVLKLPHIDGTSLDAPVLEELKDMHPIVPPLLEHRTINKLKTSFVDNLLQMIDKSNKAHPSIRATGTKTGRPTSKNPNFFNQPAKVGNMIRKGFMADEGYIFVSKDYEGQELRIMSHFSGPGPLRDVILEGRSMYAETAAVFYGCDSLTLKKGDERRDQGKKGFLAKQYLARGTKMAKIFNCDKKKGDDFCDEFDKKFYDIAGYTKSAIKFARKNGYTQSILGRRRYFDFKAVKGNVVQEWKLEREVNNAFIQGSASDQTKLAFLQCNAFLKEHHPRSRAIMEIYDEIVFHIHKEDWSDELSEKLDDIMKNAIIFDVEMKVKTEVYWPGKDGFSRWGDLNDN